MTGIKTQYYKNILKDNLNFNIKLMTISLRLWVGACENKWQLARLSRVDQAFYPTNLKVMNLVSGDNVDCINWCIRLPLKI